MKYIIKLKLAGTDKIYEMEINNEYIFSEALHKARDFLSSYLCMMNCTKTTEEYYKSLIYVSSNQS